MRNLTAAFGLVLMFTLPCAQAQELKDPHTCMQLSDDVVRLSCYDAAMGFVKPPSKSAGARVTSTTTAAAEAKFGDDGRLHTEAKAPALKHLSAQVQDVMVLPTGLYRLTLDNGQVWDTTQADSALAFKANDAVVISQGLFGSHQISLAGHTTSVSVARKQ
jgi:hypothetical protein